MFYFFFFICIATVAGTLWLGVAVYRLIVCRHHAEAFYGRIMVAMNKKSALTAEFMQQVISGGEAGRARLADIQMLRKQAENERSVPGRVKIEMQIHAAVSELGGTEDIAGVRDDISVRLRTADAELREAVHGYNSMAAKIDAQILNPAVKAVASVFGIHMLQEIPIDEA